MKKVVYILMLFTLLLASCTAQATPSPEQTAASQPIATQAQGATAQPTLELQVAPTATSAPAVVAENDYPTEAPSSASSGTKSGVVAFRIIPAESQVSYEVGEVFLNQGNAFKVAVGVTRGVDGAIDVDYDNPQNSKLGTITVDISQFKSDSGRRDGAIRDRFLESARYPNAVFVPAQIDGLPESIQEGMDYPLKVTGDLTVREVTRPVTFEFNVRLEGDQLSGQGTTMILMSDYGFGPINILNTLKTEDEVKMNIQFIARPQS